MNIKVVKESFGPYRVTATKVIDLKTKREDGQTMQDYYMSLGALYELERKPASDAEKLFWTEKDKNGKLVRGNFTRSKDIPVSDKAQAAITAVLEAAGYSDVTLEVREVSTAGPAWKTKVAGMVGGIELGLEPDQVKAAITKLITTQGLDKTEVEAYVTKLGLKL